MNNPVLKPISNRQNHNCFGCSPTNEHGLKMNFFSNTSEGTVVSEITVPDHLAGWNNLVHGGVTTTMLDEIMSWTVIYNMKTFMLTKSITVEFLKPVIIGTPLTVQGRVLSRVNEREAVAEGSIFSASGELLARSKGVFALFSIEAARKFGLMSEELLIDFERIINQN